MPIPLAQLANEIIPQRTVLFFGAGSSVPSKAPSVAALIKHFSTRFGIDADGFNLSEISGLAEGRSRSRKRLITELRSMFVGLRPTGGLMNIGLYDWKSIFKTNYDDLVEQAYGERKRDLRVVLCDFDFTIHDNPTATKLFKIHGTIEKDVSDGHTSRIILTENDYEHTKDYRESLYTRLASDLAGSHLIIIGHSLADQDIKEVVARASAMNARTMGSGRITLFLYQRDEDRAFLIEQRGLEVCFGGIDDFFAEIAKRIPAQPQDEKEITRTIDHAPKLRPITVDVTDVADARNADVSAMFNGRPATYADIAGGLTFQRSLVSDIEDFLRTDEAKCAIILGASGVGKTTIARQIVHRASLQGKACWEHVNEHPLLADDWLNIARRLEENETDGLLMVDEASDHLAAIGEIVDRLTAGKLKRLKLIVVSSRGRWAPRVKAPSIYRFGREWTIQQLRPEEIDRLLTLIDVTPQISVLVEDTFSGFSKRERRRRLVERCERDFFVCLKNIFASDNIDDIILREFAEIPENAREVYKLVAAMENAGIRVHRQLVIRLLQIPANSLAALLSDMTDVVSEYVVDAREGIYAWKCRHLVIAAIVTKYKYSDIGLTVELLERVIENISPSFEIEIRTIRELCNVDTGLPRIPDKSVQNRLLMKMISVAPAERVPRHRLIRNLIAMNAFDKAETEIRIFTKDFAGDGPVQRYKINLMVGRATRTPGLMEEDRIVILEKARETAVASAERYATNKNVLSAYAELGIEYFRRTKSYEYFDDAMARLKSAEESAGDPEFSKVIQRLERRIAGHASLVDEEEMVLDVD